MFSGRLNPLPHTVDLLAFALDHTLPATIVLISEDRSLTYAVSILRLRRYRVVLIAQSSVHVGLRMRSSAFANWDAVMGDSSSIASNEEAATAIDDANTDTTHDTRASSSSVVPESSFNPDEQDDLERTSYDSGVLGIAGDPHSGSEPSVAAQEVSEAQALLGFPPIISPADEQSIVAHTITQYADVSPSSESSAELPSVTVLVDEHPIATPSPTPYEDSSLQVVSDLMQMPVIMCCMAVP